MGDEIHKIISIRCEEEDVEIEEDAKRFLTEIGVKTSLRYSLHLIQPSFCMAKKRKSHSIEVSDIKRIYSLFVDVDRSTQFLNDYQKAEYEETVNVEDEAKNEDISMKEKSVGNDD